MTAHQKPVSTASAPAPESAPHSHCTLCYGSVPASTCEGWQAAEFRASREWMRGTDRDSTVAKPDGEFVPVTHRYGLRSHTYSLGREHFIARHSDTGYGVFGNCERDDARRCVCVMGTRQRRCCQRITQEDLLCDACRAYCDEARQPLAKVDSSLTRDTGSALLATLLLGLILSGLLSLAFLAGEQRRCEALREQGSALVERYCGTEAGR